MGKHYFRVGFTKGGIILLEFKDAAGDTYQVRLGMDDALALLNSLAKAIEASKNERRVEKCQF